MSWKVVVVTDISSAKYCDKWMHYRELQLSAGEVQLPLPTSRQWSEADEKLVA